MDKKAYFKVKPYGLNYVILDKNGLDEFLNSMDDGEQISLRLVMMTDDEYKKLPEFQGF